MQCQIWTDGFGERTTGHGNVKNSVFFLENRGKLVGFGANAVFLSPSWIRPWMAASWESGEAKTYDLAVGIWIPMSSWSRGVPSPIWGGRGGLTYMTWIGLRGNNLEINICFCMCLVWVRIKCRQNIMNKKRITQDVV